MAPHKFVVGLESHSLLRVLQVIAGFFCIDDITVCFKKLGFGEDII